MSKRRPNSTGATPIRHRDDAASGLFKAALRQHHAGSFDEAELLYRNIVALNPNHAPALSNLGVLARRKKHTKEAISYYQRAIQADPNVALTHHNLANALMDRGLIEEAQREFRIALRLKPDYADASIGLAGALISSGATDEATTELRQLLKREPSHLGALSAMARVLIQRREHEAALPYLMRTLELDPNHAEALNNLGCIYSDRGKKPEAKEYFERAVRAAPHQAQSHMNLGNMVRDLEGARAAVPHFVRATELDPKYAKAWFNLGSALTRFDRAASNRSLHEVLNLQPNHVGALICCLMEAEKTCAFEEADKLERQLVEALRAQVASFPDWNVLGNILYNAIFRQLPQDLLYQVQDRIDRLLVDLTKRHGALPTLARRTAKAPGEKLRIGYISPNFRDHPVGHVTLSLFRSHDRSRFETHGFFTESVVDESNPYTLEHRKGFDVCHSIGRLSARAAAKVIRDAAVDILIDLDGYMDNSSPPILAFRPAPVQVYWLGHAGGLGLSFVDYLIADATVIPLNEESQYREKVVRLPDVYHCADRAPIASDAPSRGELGLPEHGFVFCAFNNPQKVDAQAFDCWLRILSRVEGSSLWLSNPRGDAEMVDHLRQRAEGRGISPDRIVFTNRIADKSVHLARHRHAGLFLDTFTLNASTTALDALWAGVPLLTMRGNRFASRIATTLIQGLGLGELVAQDLSEYEERAVAFATNPNQLNDVTHRLAEARLKQPLFDIERFTRNLEHAFEEMWGKYLAHDLAAVTFLSQLEDSYLDEVGLGRTAARPPKEAESAVQAVAAKQQSALQVPIPAADPGAALRLHIGGREAKSGWQILNVQPGPTVDYVANCTDLSMFSDQSVDEIYASHVYEHLGFRTELPRALREAWRVLKPTGVLRISVPDMDALCRLLVSPDVPKNQRFSLMMHLFGAQEDAYDIHRVGFTEEFLGSFLKQAGFVRMNRVEEFGVFDDFSSFRRFGVLISLNVEAYKQ